MRAILMAVFVLLVLPPAALAQIEELRDGFYNTSCPKAESIIQETVASRFSNDGSITAKLLRLHFHDCLVKGCDASLLIDSTQEKPSEKSAGPNRSVDGYGLIDEIKGRLEVECEGTVSCADIVAVATRDAVVLSGGPTYSPRTGRRDGLTSNPDDVKLPGPTTPVAQAFEPFRVKGMSVTDFVALLGAHTVGITHCSFIRNSPMDFKLLLELRNACRRTSGDPEVFLDQSTPSVVDSKFYGELLGNRGILQLDQDLASNRLTAKVVRDFARDNELFRRSFGTAMVKMGSVDVLTGTKGEIRKNCRAFN